MFQQERKPGEYLRWIRDMKGKGISSEQSCVPDEPRNWEEQNDWFNIYLRERVRRLVRPGGDKPGHQSWGFGRSNGRESHR